MNDSVKKRKKGIGWFWVPLWKKEEEEFPQMVYFRKVFQVGKIPEYCEIRLSADSRYKLYVNGRFAQAGPSKGNQAVWYYDRIDIAPYLRKGENVLAVIVLRYPAAHGKGNFSTFRTSTPGMYIEACGKAKEKFGLEEGWKCKKREGFRIISENPYFAPMQIYEEAVGIREDLGWMEPSFADEKWADARPYKEEEIPAENVLRNLKERTIPFSRRTERTFAGIKRIEESEFTREEWNAFLKKGSRKLLIPSHSREIVEIDAGELMTGYLRLKIYNGKKSKISILQSECYAGEISRNPDPFKCMPVKGDREDSVHGKLYGYTDRYEAAGTGEETRPEIYEPFWFRTFRFIRLEIETEEEPLYLSEFAYEETGYPLEILAKADTSDQSLKEIWDISERTLRRCMHETYMDCPFYEQLQYAMDARSQILYTYASSGDDRLARKCMEDFRNAVRPDELLNCSYPSYETNVIPGFTIYYIGMVYDHMVYFKDKELIRHHMPVIERILEYFQAHLNDSGIVDKIGGLNQPFQNWSFVDWTPEWAATTGVPPATLEGPITMESLLYILGLQYISELYACLGMKEKMEKYSALALSVTENVRKCCTGKMGMLQDGPGVETYSQHTQVFGVLTGVLSETIGKEILKETLEHSSLYAQCSVAMMFYLFRALEKCSLYEYTDSLWEIWRDMVRNHMTTCAEDSLESRSDCHAWGALALYEFPAAILGVRPSKPGWEEILIAPQTGKLKWAKGEVPTAYGTVTVEWTKNDEDKADLKIICHKEAKIKLPVEFKDAEVIRI